ncbi:MAG: tyrosine-protein phosphatase [Lachnospiraceae bacterium]
MKLDIASHLLPLTGAINARDLGSYPLAHNHKTRNNVFFRSDSTSNYLEDDISFLSDKNLGLVVDLRSDKEVQNAPSVFTATPNVRYENIPMLDKLNSGPSDGVPPSLGALYVHLLDSAQSSFRRVFDAFYETIELQQSCLFHCAVGKDRTGTTAMLLLELAGANDQVIIQDYAATYDFMKPVFDKQIAEYRAKGYQVPEYMFRSDASNMSEVLSHLRDTYGNAKNYLMECGISQTKIDTIVDAFVD